jgi:hypothetical protein
MQNRLNWAQPIKPFTLIKVQEECNLNNLSKRCIWSKQLSDPFFNSFYGQIKEKKNKGVSLIYSLWLPIIQTVCIDHAFHTRADRFVGSKQIETASLIFINPSTVTLLFTHLWASSMTSPPLFPLKIVENKDKRNVLKNIQQFIRTGLTLNFFFLPLFIYNVLFNLFYIACTFSSSLSLLIVCIKLDVLDLFANVCHQSNLTDPILPPPFSSLIALYSPVRGIWVFIFCLKRFWFEYKTMTVYYEVRCIQHDDLIKEES